MQALAFFDYPEFIMAALLGIFLLIGGRQERELHFPSWLAEAGKKFLSFMPGRYVLWINRTLMYAGWRSVYSLGDFAGLKLSLTFGSLLFAFYVPTYALPVIALIAWFVPDAILTIGKSARQQEIHNSLPQALDLMVLCVDAGLGLDATLQRIASDTASLSGALNEELTILSHEILLGIDREKAYQDLYNRTGVDELKSFGSALFQAGKLGLSISKILRSQSDFTRKKQSQKAEERAMRMPIYMAFPLWFFIMPSLMVLVLAPSLIRFYHQLHGGHM
jgi:pilus assembly protein TadC